MTEPEYASFDDEAVSKTLEAARQPYEGTDLTAVTEISPAVSAGLELRAQCITVTSGNHRVCVNLPLGLGRACLPLPFDLPDGTAVQACLSIRTGPFGIPTGVCVTLFVGGEQIVRKCFP
ncbi:hypothetical protein [Pseudonocardia charpentierae]|uniref:Uncharacterized protein n=1 Tax=Pseudonocardia charpentierae TaxID=3075545 RepID=A0ABU2NJK7_9PSEU|nr:hypothetical protein [Pseudonocardia sp. DSM 45834]MDT0353608.1 hypothetical protein [Pseudonocardia sp. DSM 45834]